MALDEVEDSLLDMRPDGALAWCASRQASGRAVRFRVAHVLNRDNDPQLDLLAAWRRRDGNRAGTTQERGHLLGGADCRRKPDPLREARRSRLAQGVQPFQ